MLKKKIGIWHNIKIDFLKKHRRSKVSLQSKVKFINNLKKIGYCINSKKKSDIVKTIKAFQRHYRKELIKGIIDKECTIIAQNIRKKN